MPIVAGDIQWRYSGGAGNTDPNACLGGAISTAGGGVIDDAVKNDILDDVLSVESAAGDTEYRGIYIKNNHGSLTLAAARIYISVQTPSADSAIAIALADEAIDTTIEIIANENTAPSGPTFSAPADYASGLQLNGATGLPPGSYKGVWLRRVISAGAAPVSLDAFTVVVQGDTVG